MRDEQASVVWARSQLGEDCTCVPLKKAASSRLYFRLVGAQGSWMLMDASKELDSARQFEQLSGALLGLGIAVPEVMAADLSKGWLITQDFGERRLLEELQKSPESATHWYQAAWLSLRRLQAAGDIIQGLPRMDQALAKRESMRVIDDFLPSLTDKQRTALDVSAIEHAIDELSKAVMTQQFGLSHRDFHAANLMCLDSGELGVLDFQSAFYAPLTYDVASLLRDCYIDWPVEQVEQWLLLFFQDSQLWQESFQGFTAFKQAFDEVSLQRHLKCLGLFVHLAKQGQVDYLSALPRTLRYVQQVCRQDARWEAFLPMLSTSISR